MSAEPKSRIEEALDSDIAQLTAQLEHADDETQSAKHKQAKPLKQRSPNVIVRCTRMRHGRLRAKVCFQALQSIVSFW